MRTTVKRTKIGPLLVVAAALLPASPARAAGGYLVPPGNSAAVQYTEAYPTAGGDKSTEGGQPTHHRSPSRTLGRGNARRLQAKGAEGAAAAQLAAATAPPVPTASSDRPAKPPRSATPARHRRPASGVHPTTDPWVGGSSGFGAATGQILGLSGDGASLIALFAFLGSLIWLAVDTTLRRKRPSP